MWQFIIGILIVGGGSGLVFLFTGLHRKKKAQLIEQNPMEVQGILLDVGRQRRVMSASKYEMQVEYEVDGVVLKQGFHITPQEIAESQKGQPISVLYEKGQPTNACPKHHDLYARAKLDLQMAGILAFISVLACVIVFFSPNYR